MIRLLYVLGFVCAALFINRAAGWTQGAEQTQTAAEQPKAAAAPVAGPEMQWLWGEVSRLDAENKEVTVKYLDYETDTEKEIKISVDEKTTYDNAASLGDLKPKDTVSVDYVVSAEGKNIAKIISLEKVEGLPEVPKEEAADAASGAE